MKIPFLSKKPDRSLDIIHVSLALAGGVAYEFDPRQLDFKWSGSIGEVFGGKEHVPHTLGHFLNLAGPEDVERFRAFFHFRQKKYALPEAPHTLTLARRDGTATKMQHFGSYVKDVDGTVFLAWGLILPFRRMPVAMNVDSLPS